MVAGAIVSLLAGASSRRGCVSVGRTGREELEEMEGGGEMEVVGRRGGVAWAVEVEEEREEDGEDVTGAGEWLGGVGFLGEIFRDFLCLRCLPVMENLSFEERPSVSSCVYVFIKCTTVDGFWSDA